MEQIIMYICPNCESSYSAGDESQVSVCTECHTQLIPMKISRDQYRLMSDEEKKEFKRNVVRNYHSALEINKSVLSVMRMGEKHAQVYEYKVDTLMDCADGMFDLFSLNQKLNDYASYGWELYQMYNNELGHNSTKVGTYGVSKEENATICSHIMIFRRNCK